MMGILSQRYRQVRKNFVIDQSRFFMHRMHKKCCNSIILLSKSSPSPLILPVFHTYYLLTKFSVMFIINIRIKAVRIASIRAIYFIYLFLLIFLRRNYYG